MPEEQQQKDAQSQRPPMGAGKPDKSAAGKSGQKDQDRTKTGSRDEDEDTSTCGSGSCG